MLLVNALRNEYKGNDHNEFVDQMQQYAFDIPAMIAEGYAKNSNIEFIQSLCTAIYICKKLTAYLHSAFEANIIDKAFQRIQLGKIRKISRLLNSLIKIYGKGGILFKKSALRKSMESEIFFV
jgi:four helix bundle protein